MLPKRSKKEEVFVPKGTAAKQVSTSKAGNEKKHEENDQTKGNKYFDGKQAAVLPCGTKVKAQFDENVLSG